VPTTTRLVTIFSQLENRWFQALQHRDASALNRLLGEDFQVWTPNSMGPIPPEERQVQVLTGDLTSFHFRQVAVRSLHEESAVVSFVLSQSVQSERKSTLEDSFVVDIWASRPTTGFARTGMLRRWRVDAPPPRN
jgi:Domain of unknown function (DUF4440)